MTSSGCEKAGVCEKDTCRKRAKVDLGEPVLRFQGAGKATRIVLIEPSFSLGYSEELRMRIM